MGLQTFTGSDGARWRVWKVETSAEHVHLMDANFRTGWLVFEREDGTERRRLSQVPEDWASLGPARLSLLCDVAIVVAPARSTTTPQPPIARTRPDDR